MMIDFLGDMFICICNGVFCCKFFVMMLVFKLCVCVLDVLQVEGYICGYFEVMFDNGKIELLIEFKYYEGVFVICEIVCVFKLGC